ncbi:hypothetical protein C8J56DRAFT_896228 [Mycena floridula]|nr:hypothetical protein C8J56DRAFT_896228 [Mycena floridula]
MSQVTIPIGDFDGGSLNLVSPNKRADNIGLVNVLHFRFEAGEVRDISFLIYSSSSLLNPLENYLGDDVLKFGTIHGRGRDRDLAGDVRDRDFVGYRGPQKINWDHNGRGGYRDKAIDNTKTWEERFNNVIDNTHKIQLERLSKTRTPAPWNPRGLNGWSKVKRKQDGKSRPSTRYTGTEKIKYHFRRFYGCKQSKPGQFTIIVLNLDVAHLLDVDEDEE